jgi:monofunctional biosynthetic peptidoglycan transglycosylase
MPIESHNEQRCHSLKIQFPYKIVTNDMVPQALKTGILLLVRFLQKIILIFLIVTLIPVTLMRWLPPPLTAFMLYAKFQAAKEGKDDFRIQYRWIPWEQISPQIYLAVIAGEDQLFDEHAGFDFNAMAHAWRHNQTGKRLRGGSTITQQAAKNLFLYPGQNLFRKALEAYLTILIELFWPKQRILEMYVNIAQFGHGIYGVAVASEQFFKKPAAQLTATEAALLAASLPNPIRLQVAKPSPPLLQRRRWILQQMRQLGGINHLRNLGYDL